VAARVLLPLLILDWYLQFRDAIEAQGREDDLIEAVRRHDHDLMTIWVNGLLYLGTTAALETLASLAASGPDEACRRLAAHALKAKDQVKPLTATLQ